MRYRNHYAFLIFLFIYLSLFVLIFKNLFIFWSVWGVLETLVPSGLLSLLVVGLVMRKQESRPLLNIEFFWTFTSFFLFSFSAALIWAAHVTPDHVHFERSITIMADRKKLWNLMADPMNRPKWDPYLEKVELTHGVAGTLGAIYRFEINAMGTRVSGEQKVVELSPEVRVRFEMIDHTLNDRNKVKNLVTGFELMTDPQTTGPVEIPGKTPSYAAYKVTMSTAYNVDQILAKLMSAVVVQRFTLKSLDKYLGGLKEVAEGRIDRVRSEGIQTPNLPQN